MRWQRGQGTCPGRQCLSSIPVNYELLPWRNLCHTNLRLLLLLLKMIGLGLTRLRLELAATPCMAGAASLERREKLLETRGERETCFLLLLLSVGGGKWSTKGFISHRWWSWAASSSCSRWRSAAAARRRRPGGCGTPAALVCLRQQEREEWLERGRSRAVTWQPRVLQRPLPVFLFYYIFEFLTQTTRRCQEEKPETCPAAHTSPRLEQWGGAGVSNPPGTAATSCPCTQPKQSPASGVRGGWRGSGLQHF